jgi:8-oxo-dGTP diphosphatase
MRKVVWCAALALDDGEGRLLLAQRPPGKSFAGMWEFPGGKIEPGETPEEALRREIHEELGLALGELTPLTFVSHAYPDFHLVMPVFWVRRWEGTPTPKEGQTLAWVARKDFLSYLDKTPPADVPLLKLLAE